MKVILCSEYKSNYRCPILNSDYEDGHSCNLDFHTRCSSRKERMDIVSENCKLNKIVYDIENQFIPKEIEEDGN